MKERRFKFIALCLALLMMLSTATVMAETYQFGDSSTAAIIINGDNTYEFGAGFEDQVKGQVLVVGDKINLWSQLPSFISDFYVNGAYIDYKEACWPGSIENFEYEITTSGNDAAGNPYEEGKEYCITDVSVESDNLYLTIAEKENEAEVFIVQGVSAKTSVTYTWNEVKGAACYKVYQVRCGKKKYPVVGTTTDLTYTQNKLKRKRAYKAYVIAYDKDGKALAQTPTIHNMTKYGCKANVTKVTAKESVEVKIGAKAKLNAKNAKKDSKKVILWRHHVSAPIRYYSADPKIATVDSKGNVKGIAAGTVNIYSVAPTGVCAVTKATVVAPEEETQTITVQLLGDPSKSADVKIPKKYTTWGDAEAANVKFVLNGTTYTLTTNDDVIWVYEGDYEWNTGGFYGPNSETSTIYKNTPITAGTYYVSVGA